MKISEIQELHNQGKTVEEIVKILSLPYDLSSPVSSTNQELLSRMTPEDAIQTAEIISTLRQWKMEESLDPQSISEYRKLMQRYQELIQKPERTDAERAEMAELQIKAKALM